MADDDWTAPTTRATNFVVTAAVWNEDLVDNLTALFNALKGDASADADMLHQHKVGTFANRSAAGNAGRLYTATDLHARFEDDGSDWAVIGHHPRYCDRDRSDYHTPIGDDLAASGWFAGWRATAGVSAGTVGMKLDDHSSVELLTGASAGATWHYTPDGNGNAYIRTANGDSWPLIFETIIRIPANNNQDLHLGLVDQLSIARPAVANSCIMWRVQDDGNYYTVTQNNGGGETSNDTGIGPNASGYDVLRIEVYSASLVKFYINGTKTGTDHTAGIPSVEDLHPGYSVRANAGAGRAIYIDARDLLYKRYVS